MAKKPVTITSACGGKGVVVELVSDARMSTPAKHTRRYMPIGRPTHFHPAGSRVSACGLVGSELMSHIYWDCNCLRCMRTTVYKTALQDYRKAPDNVMENQ